MTLITHKDDQALAEAIAPGNRLVLVDYWAPWCAPCRAIAPILEDLAADFAGSVNVHKVDIQENPSVRETMKVQGIPLLALYRDGKEVDRQVGIKSRAELTKWLEAHL
jgi:thioredoxin 1